VKDTARLPFVLVTGGAGFIGSNLVRYLVAASKVRVVVLDDLSGGTIHNLPDDVEFVQGSVTDDSLLAQLFQKYRFRYVYHLAAYAAEGLSHYIRRFNYTNNLIGSVNLINESVRHGVECFVFTSSIAVYGAIEPPMREHDVPHPDDPYGIAKLAVEMDLAAANRMFSLRYEIFRPHNVYGEYQNLGDPYRNVIGIFMNQIMQGKPMTVFGDGLQKRAFSYIGDVVPMIAEAPWIEQAHNQVFNVGADQPYTVNELAYEVAVAMGTPEHAIEHLPARNEVRIAYCDHGKSERVFGKHSQTPLRAGLRRMAEWARTAGIQSSHLFKTVEVDANMPPSWRKLTSAVQSS
jgi:UDP-glucose 4-epimerase